jgi:hypothetical protein
MSTALVLGLLVVIALVLVVAYAVAKRPPWAEQSYWLANFVEDPWTVYRRSSGGFDAAAQLALQRATGRAAPTPAEHALAATIIAHNVLGQEHRPAVDPRGVATPAAVAQARRRQAMFGEARTHFIAALNGLLLPQEEARPGEPGTQFIIDNALGFAYGGRALHIENDPLAALFWGGVAPEEVELMRLDDMLAGLDRDVFALGADGELAGAARRTHEHTIGERQTAARATAAARGGGRQDAVREYVALATQNTNDPQNAHDPGVLACLRAIVERLRADQGGEAALPTTDAIVAAIKADGAALSEGRPHRLADAVAVAERTKAGERVVAVGATDEECLRRVWHRAADPRNAAAAALIRQAVFDALHDCWEDGLGGRHVVCVNGRTSRLLSALVLLDWDHSNWELKKLEQFKNDIFERAAKLAAEEARVAAAGADPGLRAAGRAHLAATPAELAAAGEVPEAAAEALAATMRAAIARMVDEYVADLEAMGMRGALPDYQIAAIKTDAQAAVSV